ncbi:hypothetical protein ACIHFD_49760 [Nonomuraea sp. NPDC051941]|uniref:hypothetical protein n=1 Tax=Nonomuraea sp. NPDC051941 TaxID=3364373 RepID=UPI0037C7EF7A
MTAAPQPPAPSQRRRRNGPVEALLHIYAGVAAALCPMMWAAIVWPKSPLALMTAAVVGWVLGLFYVLVRADTGRITAGEPRPRLRGDAHLHAGGVTITWSGVQSAMDPDEADRMADQLRALAAEARKTSAARQTG